MAIEITYIPNAKISKKSRRWMKGYANLRWMEQKQKFGLARKSQKSNDHESP